jgi:hypothetical protein
MPKRVLKQKSTHEYDLDPTAESVWISVKGFSVYICPTDEGIVVDIFEKGKEDRESIAGTWAHDNDLTGEE